MTHKIAKPFQARKGQFGPDPEMAFSVALDALRGKEWHHFSFRDTGSKYKFKVQEAVELFSKHKYKSKSGKICIVIPVSFCTSDGKPLHKWRDKELYEPNNPRPSAEQKKQPKTVQDNQRETDKPAQQSFC